MNHNSCVKNVPYVALARINADITYMGMIMYFPNYDAIKRQPGIGELYFMSNDSNIPEILRISGILGYFHGFRIGKQVSEAYDPLVVSTISRETRWTRWSSIDILSIFIPGIVVTNKKANWLVGFDKLYNTLTGEIIPIPEYKHPSVWKFSTATEAWMEGIEVEKKNGEKQKTTPLDLLGNNYGNKTLFYIAQILTVFGTPELRETINKTATERAGIL
jgi:hypothetical protein